MELKEKSHFMTEKANDKEKESKVTLASKKGQITLMTRSFGRGTDFICRDENLRKAGGIHVIQTFLSAEKSEEIQIQGRCARQGDDGSYSLVLYNKELEEFLITQLPETEKYNFLDEKRNEFFKKEILENEIRVDSCKLEHNESIEFLKYLNQNQTSKVKECLLKWNQGTMPECEMKSRSIFLMDATGSMFGFLNNAKRIVGEMFKRAKTILKEEMAKPDCFEVHMVFYRNYGSGAQELLQVSKWYRKPDELEAFLNSHEVSGGEGDEAIEIGLWHCNIENEIMPITQVILIGDAAANSRDSVCFKRQRYSTSKWLGLSKLAGENYWSQTPYKTPTFYLEELTKLKENKIKIHTFYLDKLAKSCFEEIASDPKKCAYLDINNVNKGSKELLDSMAKVILDDIGGEKFTQKYEKIYPKTYN